MSGITQDNGRELQVIKYLQLTSGNTRIGDDAYIDQIPIEVKSVTKNKGVSTARQVHLNKINKWRKYYWVFAKGPVIESGMKIDYLFVCHPRTLEPFFVKCENKIKSKWNKCQQLIDSSKDLDETTMSEVKKIMEVGTRLDDPSISWKLISTVGHSLPIDDSDKASSIIREYINQNPLRDNYG